VYDVAFISGRTDNDTFIVNSWDGLSPNATTTAAVAIYRAHLTLNDWETQTWANVNSSLNASVRDEVLVGTDLVASNSVMMVACYGATNADNELIEVNGWTTGSTNNIKIYTPYWASEVGMSQRHEGKWNESKYRLVMTTTGNMLYVREAFVRIDGLQFHLTGNSSDPNPIRIDPGAVNTDIKVMNNIVKGTMNGATSVEGIVINDGTGTYEIFNNIIYGFECSGCDGFETYNSGSGFIANLYVYNNTIYNCESGIRVGSGDGTVIAINNIVQNCGAGTCYTGSWGAGTDYNIADQSGDAPGSNSLDPVTVKFVNLQWEDFHVSPDDTNAIDAGTSTVSSVVTHDIDNEPHSTYDIGADNASVYFESTVMESGGDFTSLSSWEAANQVDLTPTSTLTLIAQQAQARGRLTLL